MTTVTPAGTTMTITKKTTTSTVTQNISQ
jgi:hypothetical protein